VSPRPQCLQAELAVGWALHALEPEDEAKLVEHVPDCHICREAIAQAEDVTWRLSAGLGQHVPPPELRAELLESVAATEQLPAEDRAGPWPPGAPPTGREITVGWHPDGSRGLDPAQAAQAGKRERLGKRQVLALAATVLLAAVGVGGLVVRGVEESHRSQQVQDSSPGQLNRILGEISAPGTRHAVLSSPTGEPVAGIKISGDQRQVLPYSLRPNEPGRTRYVLWGLSTGSPAELGAFDVTGDDRGLRQVGAPLTGDDPFNAYVISIEDAHAGPVAPTLIVASGQVAS
jgi:hypothetical protein